MKNLKLGPPSVIKRINDVVWELPTSYKKGMIVPARIYASKPLLNSMDAGVFEQVTNIASLPGIQKHALCMPDGHWGYGFPIGGVAAFDPKEGGIISPGGIGFDINCGVRLISTNLTSSEVKPKIKELVDNLFGKVPAGVGCKGFVRLTKDNFRDILIDGAKWCLDKGYALNDDIVNIEDKGRIKGATPETVSEKAIKRGYDQVGTLGSGNHFLEIQEIKEGSIFDSKTAKVMGITKPGQVCFMVHCGSRGLGHQIGTDYLRKFLEVMPKYNLNVLDRELACAPLESQDGQDYYGAMACAANMAFANRQVIMHRIREVFSKVFNRSSEDMEMNLVYDVCHNIAKLEKYKIDGKYKQLLVHRKGATRAFGPGRADSLPPKYASVGQPVIVPGSMETGSYLLAGTDKADDETFSSTAHGAGRVMSRSAAKKIFKGEELQKSMAGRGIYVHGVSMAGLAEEAGDAYKNITSVVDTLEQAGVIRKVVSFQPIGNIKG